MTRTTTSAMGWILFLGDDDDDEKLQRSSSRGFSGARIVAGWWTGWVPIVPYLSTAITQRVQYTRAPKKHPPSGCSAASTTIHAPPPQTPGPSNSPLPPFLIYRYKIIVTSPESRERKLDKIVEAWKRRRRLREPSYPSFSSPSSPFFFLLSQNAFGVSVYEKRKKN